MMEDPRIDHDIVAGRGQVGCRDISADVALRRCGRIGQLDAFRRDVHPLKGQAERAKPSGEGAGSATQVDGALASPGLYPSTKDLKSPRIGAFRQQLIVDT